MAMRLSGLMSGMDTDSVVQELVAAKRTKVDDAVKAQKKLEWKQEAWKDLNSKIKSLQTKFAANMRFSSAYTKKTSVVSNSNVASVLTGEGAVNGVQDLEVEQLAKTAYLTGGKISAKDGSSLTAMSKLSDIDPGFAGGDITFTRNGKATKIAVDKDATISDVLTELKNLGLNASFDAKNQRMFVSAKESGAASDFSFSGSGGALTALGLSVKNSGATKVDGQDAKILLNDAEFTSNTNVFEINGLTITAMQETKAGESVSITTKNDTDGIYDMIKNFITEYNTLINEMDKLYNADSAKGYEPLTDEEKEAMSESQIEEWEEKVKSAMFSGDSSVSSVSLALREVMASGFEVNGKTMYLSSFGINTMSYFTAEENERNAYHIDGDPDDASTSGNADRLKSMIASDPDSVVSFFSQLSQKLYTKMDDMSKSVTGYRSYGSFFDDKKMQTDYDSYTSKIKELEDKLADYEDKWYAKFSAMETAMAKMQSNVSAVTSMLGGM